MTQLRPSDLKAWREGRLKLTCGKCELCHLPINEGEACADHDHVTGHLRGVIHRSCNSVLGRIDNGKRYGKNFDPIAFARGLHAYLTKPKTHPLHPSHGKPKRRKK